MRQYIFKNNRGLTLTEMLVVGAIFSIIIGTILGVFVSAVKNQRYSLASQRLTDQASYVMEYMSRFLRMAKKDVNGNCTGAPKTNYAPTDEITTNIKFKDHNEKCEEFYLSAELIKQKETEIDGTVIKDLPITSNKFKVTSLKFYVRGGSQTDKFQPRVTIYLEMEGIGVPPRPAIKIQTTVSQRDIDAQE